MTQEALPGFDIDPPKNSSRRKGGDWWTERVKLLLRADCRGWVGAYGCTIPDITAGFKRNGITLTDAELVFWLVDAGYTIYQQTPPWVTDPNHTPPIQPDVQVWLTALS